MAQLTIPMLGSFSALLDDEPILTFRTAKVQALLIYLVAEKLFSPTAPQRRDAIMALL